MKGRIKTIALLKRLGLLVVYCSIAGYALYICREYMSLGSTMQQFQSRDLDTEEAICRTQPQCTGGDPTSNR